MFCPKCGAQLEETAVFCGQCGTPMTPATLEQPADGPNAETAPTIPYAAAPKKPRRKLLLIISLIVLGVAVIGTAVYYIVFSMNCNLLHQQLQLDWSRVEEGDTGSYYTLVLDFSEDKIKYNFESYFLNKNISTMKYEVVAPDQIKVNGQTHTVTFSKDKTVMTVTPALTSTDSSESWFNLD